MSPLDQLYLIACWSYIVSFHLTYSILTMDMAASSPVPDGLLQYQTMD
jgi:hypothetical protein